MKPRFLLPLVAAAAVGALLLSGPGEAVSRQRAVATALALLRPQAIKGPVVVYGLPAPLRAGTVVLEGGPSGRVKLAGNSNFRGPARFWKLKGKTWLFWEDLLPAAGFVHPSRLVLVDDATGRVKVSTTLSWWPLVGGKPAAFLLRPKDKRYVVFSNTPGTRTTSGYRRTEGRIGRLRPTVSRFTGEYDCVVMAADLASGSGEDSYFQADAAAMTKWAADHKLPRAPSNADSAKALAEEIKRLTDAGCNDVVVVLIGHGMPKPGQKIKLPDGTSVTATVGSDVAAVEVSSSIDVPPYVRKNFVTSKDIADIAKGYQVPDPDGKPFSPVHFKLIVSSCFSGRFIDDLAPLQASDGDNPDPPIRTIVTSSSSELPTALGQTVDPAGSLSYWIKAFVDGFTRIEGNPNVVKADQGDLASLITDAANSADDTAQRGRTRPDRFIRYNHPRSKYAAGTTHPHGEGRTPVPLSEVDVRPIQALFTQSLRHTSYTIYAKPDALAYRWILQPPPADLKCNNIGQVTSHAATFVWYHGDDQCNHGDEDKWGHRGVVFVTVWVPGYICHASIYGTNTGSATDSGRPRPAAADSCKAG